MYLEPYWTLDPTRVLTQGERYLFIVVGPSGMTADQIQTRLEARGWEVKSTGVPPEGLAAKLQELRDAGINTVNAIKVIGTWNGVNSMMPVQDGPLTYGAIWHEFHPAGPVAPEGPTGIPHKGAGLWPWLAVAAGAALFGPPIWRQVSQPSRRENPMIEVVTSMPLGWVVTGTFYSEASAIKRALKYSDTKVLAVPASHFHKAVWHVIQPSIR